MLITACIGFACNVINFCALNADCGASGDDEESDDELGVSKSLSASQMTKSLSESLMAVYKPSQAHKRERKNATDDSAEAKASERNDQS